MLNLRCLLDIQVTMLSRQLSVQKCVERSGLESLACNGPLTLTMSFCDTTKGVSPHGYDKKNHQEASLGATQPRKLERQEGTRRQLQEWTMEKPGDCEAPETSEERLSRGKE